MEKTQPKTLQMLINSQWLVDSVVGLGSGYQIHLVYQNSEIAPEVLSDIKNGQVQIGVLGEIIHIMRGSNRRVAVVEVNKINDFLNFIRFDLRILEVTPFVRDGTYNLNIDYLCSYRGNPVN